MHGTIRKKSQEIKTDERRHITDKAGHMDSVKQRNNKTSTTRLFSFFCKISSMLFVKSFNINNDFVETSIANYLKFYSFVKIIQ